MTTSRIPKILHFIWFNFKHQGVDAPVPSRYKKNLRRWKKHHPDWECRVWNDSAAHVFLTTHYPWFVNTFYSFKAPIMTADAFRVMVLHHFGGVYCDMDILCTQSIDRFLQTEETHKLILMTEALGVTNWFIASVKKHPFMIQLLEEMMRRQTTILHQKQGFLTTLFCTGPLLFDDVYRNYKNKQHIKLLNQKMVRHSFRHMGDGSWIKGGWSLVKEIAIIIVIILILGLCLFLGFRSYLG